MDLWRPPIIQTLIMYLLFSTCDALQSTNITSVTSATFSDLTTALSTLPYNGVTGNESKIENTTLPVDDFLYIDFYGNSNLYKLKPGDAYIYMERPDTQEYLDSIADRYQRHLATVTLNYCPYIQLCNFSFGLTPPPVHMNYEGPCCEYCSCHSDCVETRTCCPDYPDLPLEQAFRSPTVDVDTSCMLTQIRYHLANATLHDRYVMAYQTCPSNTDKHLYNRCNGGFQYFHDITLDDVIPFSDNVTMNTYKNKHCAVCNEADFNTLIPWNPTLNCRLQPTFSDVNDLISGIIDGTLDCVIGLTPPIGIKADYCSDVIQTCNVTGLWDTFDADVEKACYSYGTMIGVEFGQIVYEFKNPFCALCNGLTPSEYFCKKSSLEPSYPYSFTGLLSYRSDSSGQDDARSACAKDSMYDDITNHCRKVTCSPYRTFKTDRCEVLLESSDQAGYRFTGLLVPSGKITIHKLYSLMPLILSEVENTFESKRVYNLCARQSMITVVNSSKRIDSNSIVESVDLQYDMLFHYSHNIVQLVDGLLNMDGLKLNLDLNVNESDTITFTLHLKDESTFYDLPFDLYSNWRVQRGTEIRLDNLLSYSFNENGHTLVPYFRYNDLPGPCRAHSNIYRLLKLQPCPMFSVNMSEFGLIETKHGLTFGRENESSIPLARYYKAGPGFDINMCIDTYRSAFQKFRINGEEHMLSAELIVSVIAVSLSIACLLISLLTYCIFPQLRTLPGKNNMALISSLILAQCMYLIGSYAGLETDTIICKIFGGLTHFFWLLSLTWMNACTYHMFRVLLQTRAMSRSVTSMKHVQYHIYCVILSVSFVVINIIVSMITTDYIDIGYGETRCYINEQRMVEFTFGIPVAIIIVLNLSMFIAVVVKLKTAPTVSRNVKNERNYFFVFAKLSTITGATWLFGFLYMWTEVVAFSYIFIILDGGQGVFIMFAFVINKRTFDLYKNRKAELTSSMFGSPSSNKTIRTGGSATQ